MATDLPMAFLRKLTLQHMESLTVEEDQIHVVVELDVAVEEEDSLEEVKVFKVIF